jgi:plastocyanin
MAPLPRRARAQFWALTALALLACGEGSGMIGVMTTDTTGGLGGGITNQLLASVQVNSNSFSPNLVNLARGGTVVWLWADTTSQHDVTFNDPLLSSATRNSGSHTVTFQSSGTFNYRCTVHPGMTGSIVVH